MYPSYRCFAAKCLQKKKEKKYTKQANFTFACLDKAVPYWLENSSSHENLVTKWRNFNKDKTDVYV